jgi:hypothetical protein
MLIDRLEATLSPAVGALLLVSGCATEVDESEEAADDVGVIAQPYSVDNHPLWNYYPVVADHNLRVCVTRHPGATMSLATLQNHIRAAVAAWVDAVQPVSTVTLFRNVQFGCPTIAGDNVPLWDVSVDLFHAAGQTQPGPPIRVTLGESDPNFRHLTLHEFGHVFGLNDTYDGAGGCVPNHPSSVMCQNAAFTALQTDDVRGARQAFRERVPQAYTYLAGSPAPFRAEGSNRCIDVIGFGTANATKVQLWDCPTGPTTNQVFGYNLNTQNFVGEGSGKCLEIENFDGANGARVQIWDCWGGINQQWTFGPNGSIRSAMNGKCLEVANFGTANGSAIQMWDCHGGSNQRWTFR